MKKVLSVLLAVVVLASVFAFAGCSSNEASSENESKAEITGDYPVATIEVEDYGTISVELYYDKAPNTVKNFVSLANKGYYDGLTFHRVIYGFMIQGGCPLGTGTGDPGYSIRGEFSANNFDGNDIAHERGVISMARASYSMDTAGSQFFIMHKDAPHLDGQYAAFGRVIEGIEVVDEIAAVSTNSNDKPTKDVIIRSVTVNTNGIAIGEPETLAN